MTAYSLTPRSRMDIAKAWVRIAKDSAAYANDVQTAIYSNIELIARSPALGHRKLELTSRDVLVWPALPYRNYLIIYVLHNDEIRVVRVIHAARNKVWRTL